MVAVWHLPISAKKIGPVNPSREILKPSKKQRQVGQATAGFRSRPEQMPPIFHCIGWEEKRKKGFPSTEARWRFWNFGAPGVLPVKRQWKSCKPTRENTQNGGTKWRSSRSIWMTTRGMRPAI